MDPRVELVERFFRGTGASYDLMVSFATLGIDRWWKRQIVALLPDDATRVLDLACGTGISTVAIARRLPAARIVGVELREEYLQYARRKIAELKLHRVELVLGRAEDYHCTKGFDCICSSYLAKYADLPRLTDNSMTMLNEGGLLLMHDFTYPPRAWLIRVWRLYFALMQGMSKVAFPAWREIYHGLPELIALSRWTDELQDCLHNRGFRDIRLRHLTAYGSAIVTARK